MAAEEGVVPSLIIEVVSPESLRVRQTDLEDKVALYRLAGIPEYLIVDARRTPDDWCYSLVGYRKESEGWYEPVALDEQGRWLSKTAGLWFQVAPDGQRVLVYEYPSGRLLLNALEQEERADQAEEKLARLQAELERLRGT